MAPAFTYHIDLLEVNCSALQPIGHGLYSGLNRRRKRRAQRTFVVSVTPYALVSGLVVVRPSPGATVTLTYRHTPGGERRPKSSRSKRI